MSFNGKSKSRLKIVLTVCLRVWSVNLFKISTLVFPVLFKAPLHRALVSARRIALRRAILIIRIVMMVRIVMILSIVMIIMIVMITNE